MRHLLLNAHSLKILVLYGARNLQGIKRGGRFVVPEVVTSKELLAGLEADGWQVVVRLLSWFLPMVYQTGHLSAR